MTGIDLIDLMHQLHRRIHVTGTSENGIVTALDMEGRLFTVINGRVLNRVVPSAILNRSNKTAYLNPGGDVLWPAPEGSCFGYEYVTGKWRVPPSVTGSVWEVVEHTDITTVIRAEIDLISNCSVGIPCEFERHIEFEQSENCMVQNVKEIIRYIGDKILNKDVFRLAPWSLCQFDSFKGCKVLIQSISAEDIWDMYDPSLSQRGRADDIYVVDTNTDFRFQLGLGEKVQWIEFISGDDFRVKRYTGTLPPGQNYIDIADIPPDQFPSEKGVKLSVYCDPSGFMEIEGCGGCPEILHPGTELSVSITTEYTTNLNNKQ